MDERRGQMTRGPVTLLRVCGQLLVILSAFLRIGGELVLRSFERSSRSENHGQAVLYCHRVSILGLTTPIKVAPGAAQGIVPSERRVDSETKFLYSSSGWRRWGNARSCAPVRYCKGTLITVSTPTAHAPHSEYKLSYFARDTLSSGTCCLFTDQQHICWRWR